MLSGYGIFEGAVGVIMSLWFIHVGFMIKKLLKEQEETNRILRQMNSAGSTPAAGTKTA